jgi:hypothetical protein
MPYLQGEEVCIYGLPEVLSPQKSQITEKYWVRKSKIRKMPHLRKVLKSKKIIKAHKFADLRFAELIFGPPTFYANL